MTQADQKFRNKVYKTIAGTYVYIDASGDVGYSRVRLNVESLSWDCGVHNHWIDKDGNLKMRSIKELVLDYSVPEDLENV